MTVLPFHPDSRLLALFAGFSIGVSALAFGRVLRRTLNHFFVADDPRRQLVAQALLYAGTFIVIAVSVWLRHEDERSQ